MTNPWGYNPPNKSPQTVAADSVASIFVSIDINGKVVGDMEIVPGHEKEAALLLLNMSKGILPTQLLKQQILLDPDLGLKLQKYITKFAQQNEEEPLIKPSEVFSRH
jgi:hypothetical protein